MSKITDRVFALAKPVVENEGCSLWDVEYVREAGSWYLRVYIDKEGGVSIDDCERISRALDPLLDEADPIPDSYVFEVGSAGAERELLPGEKLNINSADEAELTLLPGIGDTLAAAIVQYRQKNGDFAAVEDIMNVSGIGEKRFENIRDYITIED